VGNFGFEVIFSRTPVRTLADLRQQRTWVWNLDESWRQQLPALGIQTVPLPVEEAARAYDDGRLDAFIAIPTAALAYQWSARTPYFTDLKTAFLPGCVVIERRVLDTLSVAHQRSVRAAGAKLTARVEDVSRAQDGALVSAVFAHQGLKRVELTPAFTSAFYDAAHQVRDRVGPKLVSQALLTEVLGWLADLRAQREAR
jgi:TRAP-type C4-dicarboxylate transport system substrate-binding protein